MSDFAKLQRHIVEQFEGDSDLLGIYCFILGNAAWGDYVFNLRKEHPAKPTEYITTMERFSKLVGKDHRRVRRELNVLAEMGVLTVEFQKQHLIITLTNTAKKNALESASLFPKGRPSKLGKCPSPNEDEVGQMPRFKLGKCPGSSWANAHVGGVPSSVLKEETIEERKEDTPPPIKIRFSSDDLEIAKLWLAYATREMSWTKPPKAWTEENFAIAIAKIRKVMDLNQEGFLNLLNYVENDTFWVTNALSPANLLQKSKNGLRKIENILKGMKTPGMRQIEKRERLKDEPIDECPFIF